MIFDEDLKLEAYKFEEFSQPFPNHFHEHYSIGLMEQGERDFSCKSGYYFLKAGDVLLLNPGDYHACTPHGQEALGYRGLNISKETMLRLCQEVTGKAALPGFTQNVVAMAETAGYLRSLHRLVMRGNHSFEKEELLLLMMTSLLQQYSQPFSTCIPACREEIHRVCAYIKENFSRHLSLEELCRFACLSKSTLLRAFTLAKGVTPYCYLLNIRVSEAKKLLEHGVPPAQAALRTGFSDQSHFTNCFTRFIGVTPGTYRDIFLD